MESFNPQIDVTSLPKVEELVFQPLEKEYLTVSLLSRSVTFFIIGLVLGVIVFINPFDLPSIVVKGLMLFFVLYLIWSFVSTIKGFKHKSYALRSKDIVYKSGWLWQSTTTAPFNRVQHVMIDQGLIERQFQLSKLKIFTAGGSGSDLTIPGLNPNTAMTLKEFIVKKTTADEEE